MSCNNYVWGGIANFIEQFETIRDFIKYILQICKIRFTDFWGSTHILTFCTNKH